MTINITNEYPGFDPEEDARQGIAATEAQKEALKTFLEEASCEETANNVILQALEQEGCPYEAEVNLTLVDDASIRRINEEMRTIDSSTDVLSFPMVDFDSPADFARLEELEESEDFEVLADDIFNPDTGELMLGDIVISVDHCLKQAEEYGHGIRREFAFLIAHSMMHLMGYDHMVPEEAAVMEDRQEAVLSSLGYTR